MVSSTKFVGILNVTPDSFSDGGKFNSFDSAITHLMKMMKDGALMIDVGAESTRPQAIKISPQEEWQRLEKILPAVILAAKKFSEKKSKKIEISIDSYHFETLLKAHEIGVDVFNDVSGLSDERIIDFIATKNITTILMHSEKIVTNPDLFVNQHLKINDEILFWAQQKIAALKKKNVRKSQLIFDVGIGFGKDAQQCLRILKNIDFYRVLELPIYVGHSKKSFLDALKIDGDRAQKTVIISKYLLSKKVDYLRVHDVEAHTNLL